MKTNAFLSILMLSTIFTSSTYAQQDSLVRTNNLLKPKLQSFETSYSYSTFNTNNIKMSLQQTNAAITFPLYSQLKNGQLDFLLARIEYHGLLLAGKEKYFGSFGATSFHSVSIPLVFKKSLSSKHSFTISLIPTLASDMKDISKDDILYTAMASFKIRKSETFAYSLGALYSRQFYGTLILPIIGVDWNITNRLILSGFLPISQTLKYQISSNSTIGLDAKLGIGGQSYRLSEKLNSSYIQFQQANSSIFYEYKVAKNFTLQVNAGYNSTQKIGLYSKEQKVNVVPFNDLNSRTSLLELSKPGMTLGSSLLIRF